MYVIHGLNMSANTAKVLYVAEALGVTYEYIPLHLKNGDHKTLEHLKRHPFGKLPTLTHNEECLFESIAIACYMAETENSPLSPNGTLKHAKMNQWLLFFTNHIGKWLEVYAFERYAKPTFGFGEPNKSAEEEALKFICQQMPVINEHLSENAYLIGKTKTVADYVAFAYLEYTEFASLSLRDYPKVHEYFSAIASLPEISRAHARLERQ